MKPTQTATIIASLLLALSSCSPGEPAPAATAPEAAPAEIAAAPAAPDVSKLPAGAYKLDPSHATLAFKVNHLGFSNYTAQFRTFTADMTLDPAQPETAKLTATVELNSLAIPAPPAGFIDELLSDTWLGASITPQMKFESTSITRTGPATADIVGNLTLKGAT
ncbi:MAG: hypothetical protein RIR41_2840, partial [Pseudomonadota bacterium]